LESPAQPQKRVVSHTANQLFFAVHSAPPPTKHSARYVAVNTALL